MIEPPSDQPQSVGDLVGRAFRIYRRHLPFFFKILLPPTIASTVGALGLQWAMTYGLTGAGSAPETWIAVGAVVITSMVILLLSKWVLALRQLAFVRMTTGFALDYREAYAYTHAKRWIVLALYILSGVFVMVALTVWALVMAVSYVIPTQSPGLFVARYAVILGASTGLLFALCLGLLISILVFSVTACENQSLGGYIGRASSLTMGGLWRSIGFALLMVVTLAALSYPLALPVVALSAFDIFQQGIAASESVMDSYKMPMYVMIVSQCWESLINMIIWPVIFIAYGFFYYDLRLRQEGLDLDRRLAALETPAA